MLSCLSACRKHDVSCPIEDCRLWIPSEQHLNCIQEFIDSKSGDINNSAKVACGMSKEGEGDVICTQQEVADVFGITRESVRQREKKGLKRLKRLLRK